jgi:hypothetical protein
MLTTENLRVKATLYVEGSCIVIVFLHVFPKINYLLTSLHLAAIFFFFSELLTKPKTRKLLRKEQTDGTTLLFNRPVPIPAETSEQ